MQTDSTAMKGGANSQPASWEAVDEGAAAGLASDRLAQAKLPFQVPPSLIPQQGSGGDTAQWQILRELRAAAPDQRVQFLQFQGLPCFFLLVTQIYIV